MLNHAFFHEDAWSFQGGDGSGNQAGPVLELAGPGLEQQGQ